MTSSTATVKTDDATALRTMPKAELHLHIEGTLEPELALRLARRNGVALPWHDLETLRRQYDFVNLQSFLDLYYQLMAVLKTADDFRDLMLDYLDRAAADGVRHAEIFFDPQVHLGNGIALDTVMDGLLEGLRIGRERHGITGGLIVCVVRDMPVASAEKLLDQLAPRIDDLIGIGLDSAEVGYPPSLFTDVFARARRMGLHVVAHAGEEGPAQYVIEALDLLHAERIDHGCHAADDDALVDRLCREAIPLTMCPLSNLRLNVVDDLRALPIRRYLDAGAVVTLNSDDPAYFGGYIGDNYEALYKIGFTVPELASCARASILSTFADHARQQEMLREFEAWQARYAAAEAADRV